MSGRRSYARPTLLSVARRCVCPRCGQGRLFDGYLTVADQCETCGLELARHDSGDGPAVLLAFALGFVVVPPALWLSLRVDWPLWLHALIWGSVVLGLTLGALRPAKAYTIALQFKHHRGSFESDSDANDHYQ